MLKNVTEKVLRFQQRHRHELSDSYNVNYSKNSTNPLIEDISLKANIFSFIAMEIIFFPVETIIHRLHIQVRKIYIAGSRFNMFFFVFTQFLISGDQNNSR